ncbi:HAD-like protein [Coprinellus micaceus]|uniref:HAD-like protein n=1 Tax=Coprinellus micaceus TaxID=71717 RepID=A0A4Y7TYM0_COPMI|nr:HAD-like protein [Coprinellus micaceus]
MTADRTILVDAILFDMDGYALYPRFRTLIDSTPGVLKAWELFSNDYNLGDSQKIAHETHGRRLYDTLKEYCKIDEEEKVHEEIDRFEDEVIRGGPVALPGALELVQKLNSLPGAKWTICTSASNKYTPGALAVAGVPIPEVGIVTSNDVSRGKPFPDPYLAGALRCGVDPKTCLIVEDAISGLNSGRAAGAQVLAVCTSTSKDRLIGGATPDFVVPDLTGISVSMVGGKIEVTIAEA